MSYLDNPWFLAFCVWTLLAVVFGVVLGRAIDEADRAADQAWNPDETQVIDWNNAPREWIA